ncbi:monovalent cation/H+ antiporter complex subunit F [Kocuria nitroreducens]|uniref:monovalent cation/H+ antiporter complex subunit F n=1 Tax=Kocuria nitroreducens TaxID=3058914 RepID=UPI0036D77664
MIEPVLDGVAVVLGANLLLCLVRVLRGPTGRDRLLGVLLTGTTGAALLAVLSVSTGVPAVRDAALVMMALAAVVAVSRLRAEAEEP